MSLHIPRDLSIAVYTNCNEHFDKLDVSILNLKFVNCESTEWELFINEISFPVNKDENTKPIKKIRKNTFGKYLWILVPIDKTILIDDETYKMIEVAFLLMFPIEKYRLVSIVSYAVYGVKYLCSYVDNTFPMPTFPVELNFGQTSIMTINAFITLFFKRTRETTFLSLPIKYFISGLKSRDLEMSYINLCISIESLIEGTTELSYRLQRACAIVNAETNPQGHLIARNFSKIYDLRSKIVHGAGSGNKLHDFREYIDYVIALVSRSIVVLINSDVQSQEELTKIYLESGFGSTDSRFLESRKMHFDTIAKYLIETKELKKVKW